MSPYDVPEGNADRELGRKIYMEALSHRLGFRYDQLGIDDSPMWARIFEEMGKVAHAATRDELRATIIKRLLPNE